MRAGILSCSRSRGIFAGISLEGTSLRPDDDATEQVRAESSACANRDRDDRRSARRVSALVDVLQKRAPFNESGKTPVRSTNARVRAWRVEVDPMMPIVGAVVARRRSCSLFACACAIVRSAAKLGAVSERMAQRVRTPGP